MDNRDARPDIDWSVLRNAATEVAQRAYAPYSGLRVGAAGLTDNGRLVTGCNVENASYGLTLCAECGLVSDLYASGGGRLVAMSCVDEDGNVLMPCGRCRQLLYEAGGSELLVDGRVLRDLLPDAFGPDDVDATSSASDDFNASSFGPGHLAVDHEAGQEAQGNRP